MANRSNYFNICRKGLGIIPPFLIIVGEQSLIAAEERRCVPLHSERRGASRQSNPNKATRYPTMVHDQGREHPLG